MSLKPLITSLSFCFLFSVYPLSDFIKWIIINVEEIDWKYKQLKYTTISFLKYALKDIKNNKLQTVRWQKAVPVYLVCLCWVLMVSPPILQTPWLLMNNRNAANEWENRGRRGKKDVGLTWLDFRHQLDLCGQWKKSIKLMRKDISQVEVMKKSVRAPHLLYLQQAFLPFLPPPLLLPHLKIK